MRRARARLAGRNPERTRKPGRLPPSRGPNVQGGDASGEYLKLTFRKPARCMSAGSSVPSGNSHRFGQVLLSIAIAREDAADHRQDVRRVELVQRAEDVIGRL